jgi:hypothetical protein
MLFHTLTGAPPDARPVPALEPRAPADLAAIVAKAMARERAQRYASAYDLAEDLKRFQTGQLVAAHRYSLAARVRRTIARHPAVALMTLVALAAWLLRQFAR